MKKVSFFLVLFVTLSMQRVFASPSSLIGPVTKTSASGHVFTLVTDYPSLGEAWKDESGIIWGDAYLDPFSGSLDSTAYDLASTACHSAGAQLPTKAQVEHLALYLGLGSSEGYKPEVLPHLVTAESSLIWTSTTTPNSDRENVFVFDGSSGLSDFNNNVYVGFGAVYGTRCVIDSNLPANPTETTPSKKSQQLHKGRKG